MQLKRTGQRHAKQHTASAPDADILTCAGGTLTDATAEPHDARRRRPSDADALASSRLRTAPVAAVALPAASQEIKPGPSAAAGGRPLLQRPPAFNRSQTVPTSKLGATAPGVEAAAAPHAGAGPLTGSSCRAPCHASTALNRVFEPVACGE